MPWPTWHTPWVRPGRDLVAPVVRPRSVVGEVDAVAPHPDVVRGDAQLRALPEEQRALAQDDAAVRPRPSAGGGRINQTASDGNTQTGGGGGAARRPVAPVSEVQGGERAQLRRLCRVRAGRAGAADEQGDVAADEHGE